MAASASSRPSLAEVHASVPIEHPSLWKRIFAFAGPAYVVSVGYMDPGNWATDLEGGARFGYRLLWVLIVSNAMAVLLQTLSARLGIVAGRDLAQACREAYPRTIGLALWFLCEIAIAACDLAEVLGAAIGLNLLLGVPLLAGVLLMAADTLIILWLSRYGIRLVEAIILSLVAIIAGCFVLELILAKPVLSEMAIGLIPNLTNESLYVAIGILGATVMPHNLYLHSALVQTRRIGQSPADQRRASKYNLLDSVIALNAALLVNGAILILAAAIFYKQGIEVTEIAQAHELLTPLLGTGLAGAAFAIALLAAGQASTITGTMAGQIVMEGFLNIRMRPWLRRLVTRSIAIIPAAATVYISGEEGTYRLLILSQVILSMQLPFAVIPLIHFTSDKAKMGDMANAAWVKALAWLAAAIIVGLNLQLVINEVGGWVASAGPWRLAVIGITIPAGIFLLGLLAWVSLEPWLPEQLRRRGRAAVPMPEAVAPVEAPAALPAGYRRILIPLDHTATDQQALAHGAALARASDAEIVLVHVEEGVTSQFYGAAAETGEVESGRRYLDGLVLSLQNQGLKARLIVRHSIHPGEEIVKIAREIKPDLVVMGAHGHRGLKDVVFGTTIHSVRHALPVPMLIVRDDG